MAKKKTRAEELQENLQEDFQRWGYLNTHGGSDPFYEDGFNMNLVRNHIIYDKRKCQEELEEKDYPKEYFQKTPPQVDNYYMANSDVIRSKATAALKVLKENQDFQYLRSKLSGDLDKDASQCMNPVRYVLGMEDAIRRDDLVGMRRNQDPENYVKYLRDSRKKLDEILGLPVLEPKMREGQLTIWDFIS